MNNLHRRHIVPTALCNLSHSLPEDTLHAIWECSKLGSVWSSLSTFKQPVTPPLADLSDPLSRFLQIHDDNRAEFFHLCCLVPVESLERPSSWQAILATALGLSSCWTTSLWLLQCPRYALSDHSTFLSKSMVSSNPISFQGKLWWSGLQYFQFRWSAIHYWRQSQWSYWGVIHANSLPPSIAEVEALACCRAVQFAVEIGLHEVMFEGDSLTVIHSAILLKTPCFKLLSYIVMIFVM